MAIRIKNQKFYRTEDLVDILPLAEPSIRKYLRSGKIQGVKIGLFWYISESNLNRFLQGEYAPDKKQEMKLIMKINFDDPIKQWEILSIVILGILYLESKI